MKYSVVALAVAGALLSSQAMADVRVSGRIKPVLLFEKLETKETNTVKGTSSVDTYDRPEFQGNSRIRFSGKESLNKDWTFLYSLEYNIYIDKDKDEDSGETQFSSRSTYAGVESKKYGRFRLGRQTLPGEDIDMATVSPGDAYGTGDPFGVGFDSRTNNSFQYASPYFGRGGKNRIKFQYGMDEGDDKTAYSISTYDKETGNIVSKKRDVGYLSFLHADEKFSYGVFYAQAGNDLKAVRGSVRYELPRQKMGFGATVQHADYASDANELGAILGANYYYNDEITFYAQAGHSDNYKGVKDATKNVASLGVSHYQKLSSGSLLKYVALSHAETKTSEYDYKNRKIKYDTEGKSVELGLQYSF